MDEKTRSAIAEIVARARIPREDVERQISGSLHRRELSAFGADELQDYLECTA